MQTRYNEPNYGYLVDVVDDKGRVRYCYVIEQCIPVLSNKSRVEATTEAIRHRLRQVTARMQILHVMNMQGPLDELMRTIEKQNIYPE